MYKRISSPPLSNQHSHCKIWRYEHQLSQNNSNSIITAKGTNFLLRGKSTPKYEKYAHLKKPPRLPVTCGM